MRDFPWGDDPNPEGGYKVGDIVGIFHSDHDDYLFDNPYGVVTAVADSPDEEGWDEGHQHISLTIEVDVGSHKLYLIERPKGT